MMTAALRPQLLLSAPLTLRTRMHQSVLAVSFGSTWFVDVSQKRSKQATAPEIEMIKTQPSR